MSTENEQETRELPIEWHVSENIVSHYANNMVVQHSENEIILSFFETRPPMLLGRPEDLETLRDLKAIRSECVARIIIAPDRMPSFIEVMQANYDRYLAKKQGDLK